MTPRAADFCRNAVAWTCRTASTPGARSGGRAARSRKPSRRSTRSCPIRNTGSGGSPARRPPRRPRSAATPISGTRASALSRAWLSRKGGTGWFRRSEALGRRGHDPARCRQGHRPRTDNARRRRHPRQQCQPAAASPVASAAVRRPLDRHVDGRLRARRQARSARPETRLPRQRRCLRPRGALVAVHGRARVRDHRRRGRRPVQADVDARRR